MLAVADSYHSSPFLKVVFKSDPIVCFWFSVEGVGIWAATGSESESAAPPGSGPPPSAIMQRLCRYRERADGRGELQSAAQGKPSSSTVTAQPRRAATALHCEGWVITINTPVGMRLNDSVLSQQCIKKGSLQKQHCIVMTSSGASTNLSIGFTFTHW